MARLDGGADRSGKIVTSIDQRQGGDYRSGWSRGWALAVDGRVSQEECDGQCGCGHR
jgi:hypothetical protein